MLKDQTGTVVTRPGLFKQARLGPNEGYSTWFYADVYGYNPDWISTLENAENDEWWNTINLSQLHEQPVLPDGRWYKTQADISDVIRGFKLCCQSSF